MVDINWVGDFVWNLTPPTAEAVVICDIQRGAWNSKVTQQHKGERKYMQQFFS